MRCFGLDIRRQGSVPPRDRPLIVLPRHASLIDSFLPAVVLGGEGWRLRYVLKKHTDVVGL